jgi:F-type H+-transporting ATPase subunit a
MAAEEFKLEPFGHVADSHHIQLFEGVTINLPTREDLPSFLQPIFPEGFTKFMLLQLLAAAIMLALFLPLARRIATGEAPRGRLWNFLEWVLTFVRDQIARPGIGEHDYKRFLPLLWTMFLFILLMNLLGMVPFLASPTASLAVTGVLALVSFIIIHVNGVRANHGLMGYMKTFVPPIDTNDPVMKYLGPPIKVMMFFLEILSAFIRAIVLAVRLFANMLAGHTVLFIILSFIAMIGHAAYNSAVADKLFWPVTGASVLLSVALSLLELFVACLQAFVFVFLTAIFIGLAMHPQH